MLSERRQTQKGTYWMIPFIWYSGIGKTIGMENRSVVAKGRGSGSGWLQWNCMGEFHDDGTVLYSDCGGEHVTLCIWQNA